MYRIASLVPFAFLAACSGASASQDTSTATQTAALSSSDASDGHKPPHGPHKPPQAAFDACASKAAGDACTVALGDKSVDGKCVTPPPGAPETAAFCAPPHPPHGGPGKGPHGKPPEQVFTACDGKSEGNACTVTFGDHTVDGTCSQPPPDSGETRLGCRPNGPPPGHD